MSFLNPKTSAEAGDRMAVLTGFATGFAAVVHSINVWRALVGPDLAAALDAVQMAGGILIVALFLPLFIWFKLGRSAPAMNPWKSDSYLGSVAKRAGFTAFAGLLLAGVVLSTLSTRLLPLISGEMMLDMMISAALGLFSLSFFIFSSGPDGDAYGDAA